MTPNRYSVVVGNVGTVYDGANNREAQTHFSDYVKLSKENYGRVGNEPVYLFMNGDPIREYEPEHHAEYDD